MLKYLLLLADSLVRRVQTLLDRLQVPNILKLFLKMHPLGMFFLELPLFIHKCRVVYQPVKTCTLFSHARGKSRRTPCRRCVRKHPGRAGADGGLADHNSTTVSPGPSI